MKSFRIFAVIAFAAASSAAFANGGGARGGVYPATAPAAAVSASHAAVVNSGVGGVVSTTSESGKAAPVRTLSPEVAKLYRGAGH
ncbi:hypothetical protein G3A43_06410 [Paraburkholderia aspalathi]|nr:hypothetical protein [Paraburkholderia aspalathi]MBK3779881.1 hypothetical protein [Paraburkholderia aspalathi]